MRHGRPEAVETYGPDPWLVGMWVVVAGAPAPIFAMIALRDGLSANSLEGLLLALIAPAAAAVFLLRFRVTFTSDAFVYLRWEPTIVVCYQDIRSIDVAGVTPQGKQAVGAALMTRTGERLPVLARLFPRPAVKRFFDLAGGGS